MDSATIIDQQDELNQIQEILSSWMFVGKKTVSLQILFSFGGDALA